VNAGSTYRRCSCRDPQTGRNLGSACPKLNGYRHGIWFYRLELPANADGARRPRRRGGFATEAEARAELDHARALLEIPERDDAFALTQVGDLIETAIKNKQGLPGLDAVRKKLAAGVPVQEDLPTVEEWLQRWLPTRRAISTNTHRSYESHIRLYLTPALGRIRLDRLRVTHIAAMFDAISEHNERIADARASDDPAVRASVKGQRTISAASMQRIRATLRKAINDAIRQYQPLLTVNPASFVELPSGARPKAQVWTPQRVARWQATGEIPSKVMVWTPDQTAQFLNHATGDRLYPLFHLVTFRGLRRGEACGARWSELDLANGTLAVSLQLLQHGWATSLEKPKTDDSDAIIALDTATIAVLTVHRRNQQAAAGEAWPDTDLIFTKPNPCTPPTSPTGSNNSPPKLDSHPSASTTSATAPPPWLSPPAPT
jgi:integrase